MDQPCTVTWYPRRKFAVLACARGASALAPAETLEEAQRAADARCASCLHGRVVVREKEEE